MKSRLFFALLLGGCCIVGLAMAGDPGRDDAYGVTDTGGGRVDAGAHDAFLGVRVGPSDPYHMVHRAGARVAPLANGASCAGQAMATACDVPLEQRVTFNQFYNPACPVAPAISAPVVRVAVGVNCAGVFQFRTATCDEAAALIAEVLGADDGDDDADSDSDD